MSEAETKKFKELIEKNLRDNGFPHKNVSLPLEKLYEVADKRGVNLNAILDEMREEGISVDSEVEKIVFVDENEDEMDQEDMMKKYQEMMSQMTPEQMTEIQKMYENMSPEEKEEIMRKGKDMGLL